MRVNAYESDRLELYTKRENIRVSGIQEESDEDLIQKKNYWSGKGNGTHDQSL